jgi:GxxExxY protein
MGQLDHDERVRRGEPDADLDACARAVMDAAFRVHRVLGPGFLESVYEEALAMELELRYLSFERQVPVDILPRRA